MNLDIFKRPLWLCQLHSSWSVIEHASMHKSKHVIDNKNSYLFKLIKFYITSNLKVELANLPQSRCWIESKICCFQTLTTIWQWTFDSPFKGLKNNSNLEEILGCMCCLGRVPLSLPRVLVRAFSMQSLHPFPAKEGWKEQLRALHKCKACEREWAPT